MSFLLLYLAKVCICSGLLLGYYYLALRNKLFHHWNRFYLLSAVALSLLLPLISLPLLQPAQAHNADVIRLLQVVAAEEVVVVEAKTAHPLDWVQLATVGYAAVCVTLLALLVHSLLQLRTWMRTGSFIQAGDIRIVESTAKGTPFSFLRHIFWNASIDISSAAGQQILQHEIVHVREGHTWDKLAMQVVLVLFWVNPFFWIIRAELRLVHEFIADKKSVAGADAAALAALLLQTAYPQHAHQLSNPFFHPSIKRRLAMIKKLATPQRSYLSRIVALPLIVLVAAAFTLKPVTDDKAPVKSNELSNSNRDTIAIYKPLQPGIDAVQVLDEKRMLIRYKNGKEQILDIDESRKRGMVGVVKYFVQTTADTIPKVEFNSADIESVNVTSDSTAEIKLRNGKTVVYKSQDMRKTMGGHGILVTPSGRQKFNQMPVRGKFKLKPGDSVGIWPIIFIDGEEYTDKREVLEQMDPSTIESINVLKNESAVALYGERGRRGVIQIKLKPGSPKPSAAPSVNSDRHRTIEAEAKQHDGDPDDLQIIFTKTEIEPGFPGGSSAWRRYLQRNANPEAAKKQGAPKGTHTVKASFIVNADGTLEQIRTTTNEGFGMEQQVTDLLKHSPRWEPAIQNGKAVRTQHEVIVTFLIS